MSSETSRSAAATGKAYRALKELARTTLATLSAALAIALNPNPNPNPDPDPTTLTPTQVEEQCNDPKLMHCGLEKCVAADGSVEWVAAHSKVRLEPHLSPWGYRVSLGLGFPVPTAVGFPRNRCLTL